MRLTIVRGLSSITLALGVLGASTAAHAQSTSGEPIKIAAKRVVRLRAAKVLADAILGGKK